MPTIDRGAQRVHVIDDNPVTRELVHAAIARRLERIPELRVVRVEVYKYLWRLDDRAGNVKPGDVAVCDLYSLGYYQASPRKQIFKSGRTKPGSVENIRRAVLDLVANYMEPLRERGVTPIVYTHVLQFLRKNHRADAAAEISAALALAGLDLDSDVIEKAEHEVVKPEELASLSERVVEAVLARVAR
jgi:hypothetical protein